MTQTDDRGEVFCGHADGFAKSFFEGILADIETCFARLLIDTGPFAARSIFTACWMRGSVVVFILVRRNCWMDCARSVLVGISESCSALLFKLA